MGMWTIPTILACIIICVIGYWLTVRVGHNVEAKQGEQDSEIPETISEHPFLLNPIILSYVVFGLFGGIIIFYNWAKLV